MHNITQNIFYDTSYITFRTGTNDPINNVVYANYFEKFPGSTDWSQAQPNYFNYSGIGNYYYNFNESNCTSSTTVSQSGCTYSVCIQENVTIDATNSIIDYRPVIRTSGASCPYQTHPVAESSSTSSSNAFPFGNLLIGLMIIIFSLIL